MKMQWFRKYHDEDRAFPESETEIEKSLDGYYDLKIMDEIQEEQEIKTPNCLIWFEYRKSATA